MGEKAGGMEKTNFDRYLEEQMKEPAFAERFVHEGVAWDTALRLAELPHKDLRRAKAR